MILKLDFSSEHITYVDGVLLDSADHIFLGHYAVV